MVVKNGAEGERQGELGADYTLLVLPSIISPEFMDTRMLPSDSPKIVLDRELDACIVERLSLEESSPVWISATNTLRTRRSRTLLRIWLIALWPTQRDLVSHQEPVKYGLPLFSLAHGI